jgi:hypothetical protein
LAKAVSDQSLLQSSAKKRDSTQISPNEGHVAVTHPPFWSSIAKLNAPCGCKYKRVIDLINYEGKLSFIVALRARGFGHSTIFRPF